MNPLIILLTICALSSSEDESSYTHSPNVSSTTPKSKFGLAWLFSSNKNSKKNLIREKQEEEKELIDKRALDTNLYITASRGKMRVLSHKSYESGDLKKENLFCNFDDSIEQVEAREGEDVELTCRLQNLHYEIDLNKLKMEWNWIESSGCNESAANVSYGDKIVQVKPKCMIITDFPFDDLQTSSKNISCSADIVLFQVTVNNTGKYRCTASIGFSGTQNIYNHLYGEVYVRVSRRNNYSIHKIVSIIIVTTVLVVSFMLLFKKILKFKLPWEGKNENYAAEWPVTVPARRIASSGSLGRRLSGPIILEEEEEEEDERDSLEEVEVIVSEDAPIKSSLKRPKLDSIGGLEFNF
uniref:Ig-like domain-containing protein n=1 Tax=Lepeophtheirus salmonis TaxID=72036 RepID=A0A0K2TVZ7_LEPSM